MITYPLNNIDYTAEDAELYFSTRESGVYDGNDFEVTVSGIDNDVTVGTGIAWIHNTKFSGKVVALKEPKTLTLSLPNSVYDRIDAIVVQFDANNNATDIIVKEGIASSSPVAPAVVRTESLYELHIFHVQRKAGATVISVDNLVDLRNDSNYCGIMFDPISSIDATLTKRGFVADAAETGKQIKKATNVRNLLDNSDFTNPVNQRGATSYSPTSANQYTIDRWKSWTTGVGVNIVDGGLKLSNSGTSNWANFTQTIEANDWGRKTLTFAICDVNNNIYCGSLKPVSGDNKTVCGIENETIGRLSFELNSSTGNLNAHIYINPSCEITLKWAALYEGEYTAETLPPYVPKGNTAEVLECKRYLLNYAPYMTVGNGVVGYSGGVDVFIPCAVPMRIAPSYSGTMEADVIVDGKWLRVTTTPQRIEKNENSIEIRFADGTIDKTYASRSCQFRLTANGRFTLSADL